MRTDPEEMILKVYEGGRGGKIAQPSNEQITFMPATKSTTRRSGKYTPSPVGAKVLDRVAGCGAMAFAIGAMIGVQF